MDPFLGYEAATRCCPLQLTYLDLPGKGCQVCLSKLQGVSLQHGFLGFFMKAPLDRKVLVVMIFVRNV